MAAIVSVTDMNNSIKLIIALGASALPSMLIAALALAFPAKSHHSSGDAPGGAAHVQAAHGHMGAVPSRGIGSGQGETTFYAEIAEVNGRMHEGMAVAPTGDVDRDFARTMIPHHQGAIDMALVLLKYGHDERLRRLAQSIIVEQGQEIEYMRLLQNTPATEPPMTHHGADH